MPQAHGVADQVKFARPGAAGGAAAAATRRPTSRCWCRAAARARRGGAARPDRGRRPVRRRSSAATRTARVEAIDPARPNGFAIAPPTSMRWRTSLPLRGGAASAPRRDGRQRQAAWSTTSSPSTNSSRSSERCSSRGSRARRGRRPEAARVGKAYRERIYRALCRGREQSLAPATLAGLAPRRPISRGWSRGISRRRATRAILDLGCGHGALLHVARGAGYTELARDRRQPRRRSPRRSGSASHGVRTQGDLFAAAESLPRRADAVVVAST